VTPASVTALRAWVDAVNTHKPGVADAAVRGVAAMSYSARVELNKQHPLFMRVLLLNLKATRGDVERAVTILGERVRFDIGGATFLKRAAILHGDAVIFATRFPASANTPSPPDVSAASRDARFRRAVPPLLLTNEPTTITRDGEPIGTSTVNWNLPFARSLLDMLLNQGSQGDREELCPDKICSPAEPIVRASDDDVAFVLRWYHAMAAYLLATGLNADAKSHVLHAARTLPDDANLLFDRATLAETFGLPIYQVVDHEAIPAEAKTNAEAEHSYRRALELDPTYVEARVRLARLLEHRGKHAEAEAEIVRALDAAPAGVLGYYAHIVAGRIAMSQRRYEDALRRYQQASALFATAQAARLGASHAALMLADVPKTLSWLTPVTTDAALAGSDPWLDYSLGAGRDANRLLADLWAGVAR
jgi:tetratricopeptide (TPR) repeat protein